MADLRTSLRLDPGGADLARRLQTLSSACCFALDYEEAVAVAQDALERFPGPAIARHLLFIGQVMDGGRECIALACSGEL